MARTLLLGATLLVWGSGCEVLFGIDSRELGAGGHGGGTTTIATAAAGGGSGGDPKNCGAVGHDCLGGKCESGICQPFVIAFASHPAHLALDSTFIYFEDAASASINRCPLSGCGPQAPAGIVDGYAPNYVFAIDPSGLYFAPDSSYLSLLACPTVGPGCLVTPVMSAVSFDSPRQIALDPTDVYFLSSSGLVDRCSKTGCAAPTHVAPNESTLGFTLDGAFVYWKSGPYVKRCVKTACSTTSEVVTDSAFETYLPDLQVRNDVLYLTSADGLYRCSLGVLPCQPSHISSYGELVRAFTVDSEQDPHYLYFSGTQTIPSPVLRIALDAIDTEAPTVVLDNQADPAVFVSNEKAVFWANNGFASKASNVVGIAR